MCGIIGYVGPSEAYPILLDGLSRLEYRGYDSAGVATIVDSGKLEIRRAKGKLENLRAPARRRRRCKAISESGTRDGRRMAARPRKMRIRTKPARSP